MIISLDIKSLVIGFLTMLIIGLIVNIVFLNERYKTAILLSMKQETMINLYDKCLDDNRLILNVTLNSVIEAQKKK